jgi:sugar phosphate permease
MSFYSRYVTLPPAATERVPEGQIVTQYEYWRNRLLWSTYFGYAVFYILRKNLAAAVPAIQTSLGVSREAMGGFFTAHEVTYGFSKFLAGVLADRFNPRFLVAAGMLLAALTNLGFGLSSSVQVLGVLWVVNGFFQGFGFPPCARVLSFWFAPAERGVKWGIFNTSHQVGAFVALTASGWLCLHYGWRSAFIVPAVIGIATSVFLFERVRDSPDSLGLPPVETYKAMLDKGEIGLSPATTVTPVEIEEVFTESSVESDGSAPIGSQVSSREELDLAAFVNKMVYRNPQIWLLCIANFFVYVVRGSFLNWAPTYLHEVKGLALDRAGFISSFYELAGLVGCLLAGYVTDRFWKGRRSPACVLYMLACAGFITLFWKTPEGHPVLDGLWLSGVGFTIYGPQFLVGVMMADLATKRAAGNAVGLSGLFGYMSGFFSGYGLSKIQVAHGWGAAFACLIASALIAVIPFLICWNAKPIEEDAV